MSLELFIEQNKDLLNELFESDLERARRWLEKYNQNFGSVPEIMINKGRGHKVKFFLEQINRGA